MEDARKKALNTNRSTLIAPDRVKKAKDENIVPLVLTHHPCNKQVQKIIMDHWGVLKFSEKCRKALTEKPLFTTRRSKNLKDNLVRSRLDPPSSVTGTIVSPTKNHCNKQNCPICLSLKADKAISSITLQQFKTPKYCSCTSTNVVYLLTCSACQKQYVGETKRAFCVRFKEHLADIRHNRDKPIVHHIKSHNESEATIIPQIMELIRLNPDLDSTTTFRRKREIHWIYSLRTLAPEGLNTLGKV